MPANRSRTIARATTMPAAPAAPCSSRTAQSVHTSAASAHSDRRRGVDDQQPDQHGAAAAERVAQRPGDAAGRQPRPIRLAVSVSCTAAGDAERSCASDGSAGRYMSVESGANIESAPSSADQLPARQARRLRRGARASSRTPIDGTSSGRSTAAARVRSGSAAPPLGAPHTLQAPDGHAPRRQPRAAAELDRADPLARFRDEFLIPDDERRLPRRQLARAPAARRRGALARRRRRGLGRAA